jgi:hypothetical protein
MEWIIKTRRIDQDQEFTTQGELESSSADFNSPLADNDGGVCVAEQQIATCENAGQHEADDDIRKGQVKTFDSIDALIEGLKQSW